MKRREFITLVGGAAALPLAAHAQQADGMRRIGVLMSFAESDREGQDFVIAFREGLQKLGWAEGRTIRIDTRWAALHTESMQRFAKELVALQPDLILSQGTPTTKGDIDTAVVDSLKVLDPKRPIREADISERQCDVLE